MKLLSLTLSNYRGFGEVRRSDSDYVQSAIEIKFEKDITVIAGVNGSGKSGILRAISGIASYLAPEISPAKRDVIPFSDDDIHHGKQAFTISARFKGNIVETSAQIVRVKPDPMKAPAILKEIEDLRANRRFLKKDSKEDKKTGARIEFLELTLRDSKDTFTYQTGKIENPGKRNESPELLMVYYPTNRVFGSLPPRLAGVEPVSPADAYSKALNEVRISLNDIANWYRAVQGGLIGNKKFGMCLIAMMEATIGTLVPGFSELALETTPRPHFTIEKHGHRFNLDQLSDGEKALLALAFDLTRRLTIANPKSKNPVVEGMALVMIDEIELHLHPKWQRQVVGRLLKAFPNCQFIITTHSPQILGELDARKILVLDSGKAHRPLRAFGMDSSRVLEEIMDAAPRNKSVSDRLRKLAIAVDKNNTTNVFKLLSQLRRQLGDTAPEVLEAETMLQFLGE
jgi:predicted ATP-binding protein involved in virulence